MKLGKELKVDGGEWEEACMDYNGLKRMLEEMMRRGGSKGVDGVADIECQPSTPVAETEDSDIMLLKKVDEELNKVCAFYKVKVNEVMEEGGALLKQMDAIVNLRSKVKECQTALSKPPVSDLTDMTVCDDDEQKPLPDSSESNVKEILEEFEANKNNNNNNNNYSSFSKEELKQVERSLELGFLDFCRQVNRLKQYSFVNLSAFSKILNKYDQIASTTTTKPFLTKVENSYLANSDEITDLLNKVEHKFAKHFPYSKSKEGKRLLRPEKKRDKHSITFLSGLLLGCSIALFVAVVLLVQTRKLLDKESAKIYMDNIFPLYSLYAFIILHMLVHAADIYFWRRYRINYPFLFNLKQGTELGYREIFVISSGLAVLVLSTFLVQLHIRMDSNIQENVSRVELVPLVLLIVVFLIIFCPFNIFYRSTRLFLLGCFFRCLCAPFFKVTLPDSFLGDQLTSQVQTIRNLQHYVCFYGWRSATQKQIKCQSINGYIAFFYILPIIPYWLRFLQSIRRMIEEKKVMHGFTAARFIITVMAVVFQTLCRLRKRKIWKVLGLVSTVVTVTVNTYSDIVLDWGLLRWKSKNKLLRDKLLVPHKTPYFIAIVVVVILRFAWLQQIFDFDMRPMRRQITPFMITVLEILRRGIWNFFWLENEQLNNVGKYRAFKSVPPLPFRYCNKDDNDKDGQKGD
nr:phosphate transporter PHO1 homolog 10-like [Ipomoea trifida]